MALAVQGLRSDVFMAVWTVRGLRSDVFMGFEKNLGGAIMTVLMGLAR